MCPKPLDSSPAVFFQHKSGARVSNAPARSAAPWHLRDQGDHRLPKPRKQKNDTAANLGFEAKLWAAADALRNNMDAAEYKHVVLGLIFLKYISDAFEAKHAELESQRKEGADPDDPDDYRAENIF